MQVLMCVGIALILINGFFVEDVSTKRFLYLVTWQCMFNPIFYLRTLRSNESLIETKFNNCLLRPKKIKSVFRRFMYGYDANKGMCPIVIIAQLLIHVYVLLSLIHIAFCAVPLLNQDIALFSHRFYLFRINIAITFVLAFFLALLVIISEKDKWIGKEAWEWTKIKNVNGRKILKELQWQIALCDELEKRRYRKEKGVYYILEEDIEYLNNIVISKYKRKALFEISQNEKGQDIYRVLTKKDNKVLFEYPIKKSKNK